MQSGVENLAAGQQSTEARVDTLQAGKVTREKRCLRSIMGLFEIERIKAKLNRKYFWPAWGFVLVAFSDDSTPCPYACLSCVAVPNFPGESIVIFE
jgi:hypothetical protein